MEVPVQCAWLRLLKNSERGGGKWEIGVIGDRKKRGEMEFGIGKRITKKKTWIVKERVQCKMSRNNKIIEWDKLVPGLLDVVVF